jgi:hypothetical protein
MFQTGDSLTRADWARDGDESMDYFSSAPAFKKLETLMMSAYSEIGHSSEATGNPLFPFRLAPNI